MTAKPREPAIAAIRELLLAAFSAETLVRFCQDRPLFRPVLAEFSPGHGLADMVDELVTFCQTRRLWDELLREVQQENPSQYAHFGGRLYEDRPAWAVTRAPTRVRTKWPWQPPRRAWFWPAVGGLAVALIAIVALLGPEPGPPDSTITPPPDTTEPTGTPDFAVVPSLRDQRCDGPLSDLQTSSLRRGAILWEADGEVDYYDVIRTDPPAGTEVERGSEVTLVCSLGPMRPVPNVEGQTLDDAERELEHCSHEPCFKTQLEYEIASTPDEVDHVIRTDPSAGMVVEPGSLVILFVGAPKVQVSVPVVAELTVEQATERLAKSQLNVGDVLTETSKTVETDRVIRSEPPSGQMVDTGSDVILVVSSGTDTVKIPDLIDWTWQAASAELERLGLQPVKSSEQYHDDIAQGNVVESDPPDGTMVDYGSEVMLKISVGPMIKSGFITYRVQTGSGTTLYSRHPGRNPVPLVKDKEDAEVLGYTPHHGGCFAIWVKESGNEYLYLVNKEGLLIRGAIRHNWVSLTDGDWSMDGSYLVVEVKMSGDPDIEPWYLRLNHLGEYLSTFTVMEW